MVDNKRTSWLKRGLALFLAVATLLATTGINPGVFAEVTAAIPANSGDSLTQAFKSTAPANGSETVSGITANLKLAKDVSYTIVYQVYQNFSVGSTLDDAAYLKKSVYTNGSINVTGTGEDRQPVTIDFGTDKVVLSQNEVYAVKLTVNNAAFSYYDNAGQGAYLNDAALGSKALEFSENATTGTSLPGDVTSISLSSDKKTIDTGDSLQITGTTNVSDRYRPLTYTSSDESIAKVDTNGKVTAQSQTGVATITASYGSVNSNIVVNVVKASLATTTFSYDGLEHKPVPEVSGMTQVSSAADNGYMLTYAADTKSAGDKTVTIKGYGTYSGYEKILPYTIAKTDITQAAVDASTISVNSSGTVTAVSGLTINGNTLVLNQDFTATADIDSKNSTADYGMYTVTIKGTGNYSGTITKASVKSIYGQDNLADINKIITASLKTSTYQYMGRKITPIYSGMTTNISTVDIFNKMVTLSYGDNTSVGDGTVTLTGNAKNGYTGTITLTFKITPRDISSELDATGADNTEGKIRLSIKNDTYKLLDADAAQYKLTNYYVHTGNQIKPEIDTFQLLRSYSDSNGADLLDIVSSKDYVITYENATSIGTGKMLINGTGNYTGTIELQYDIIPDFEKEMEVTTPDGKIYSASDAKVDSAGVNTYATTYAENYTGSETTPSPVLKLNRKTLKENTDYVITRENNINAGTASITATGKDGSKYAGKKIKITYTINKRDISSTANVTLPSESYVYTGETVKPSSVKVTDVLGGVSKDLTAGTDYELSYSSAVNAGTATVTATGTGNYTGKVTGTYTIASLNISSAKANPSSNPATDKTGILVNYKDEWVVTGSEIKPPVSLTYNNGTSTVTLSPSDYDVTYSNNTKETTEAKIMVAGKNNLTGTTAQFNFKISSHTFDDVTVKVHSQTATKVGTSGGKTTFKSDYNPTYSAGTSLIKASDVLITDADGNQLVNQTDYTMSTVSSKATQDGTITIVGKSGSNYSGALATVTFTINKRDISDQVITIKPGKVDTNNKPTAAVIDTTNGAIGSGLDVTLTEGTDYYVTDDPAKKQTDTITWSTSAGMHTFYINGIGNYTGSSAKLDYQIGKNLADSDVYYKLVNPGNDAVIYYDSKPLSTNNTSAINVPYLGDEKPKLVVYEVNNGAESVIADTNYDVTSVNAASGNELYKAGNTVKMMVTAKDGNTQYFSTADKPVAITYTINQVNIGVGYIFSTNAEAPADGLVVNGKYKQGIVRIDNSASQAGTIVPASDTFSYYFAHQTDKAVDSKLIYYPYGNTTKQIALTSGTDYKPTPAVFNPEAVKVDGDRNVVIKYSGLGNYVNTSGDVNYYFTQVDIANSTVKVNNTKYDSANTPKFSYQDGATSIDSELEAYGAPLVAGTDYTATLLKGSTALALGTDYTITYSGNTAKIQLNNTVNTGIGTYTIKYAGTGSNSEQAKKGTYYGTQIANFSVTQRTVANATVSSIADQTYDGTAKTPDFTVTDNGKTLVKGTDYTIEWSNNTYPGIATATIKGSGKYSEEKQVTFKIIGDLSSGMFEARIDGKKVTEVTGTFSTADIATKADTVSIVDLKKLDTNSDPTPLTKTVNYTVDSSTCSAPNTGNIVITGVQSDSSFYKGSIKIANHMTGDISSADIKVTDIRGGNYTYSGSNIDPELSVTAKYGTRTFNLVNGADYSIEKSNNNQDTIAVGPHTYDIVGKGDYAGQKITGQVFYIKYDLSNAKISFKNASGTYVSDYSAEANGSEQKPIVKVTVPAGNSETTLTISQDYVDPSGYGYSNNINPGTATVYVKAPDNSQYSFGQSRATTFEITSKKLTQSNTTVTLGSFDNSYTGIAIYPPVDSVKYNSTTTLTEGKDYTVSYGTNIDSGKGESGGYVEITGMGEYSGSYKKYFDINTVEIDPAKNAKITLSYTEPEFAGVGVEVHPTITEFTYKYDGNNTRSLVEGTDYTVKMSYKDESALTGTLVITGKGNYSGSITKDITVKDRDIGISGTVKINNLTFEYNGKAPSLGISVICKLGYIPEGKTEEATYTLKKDTDYTIQTIDGNSEYTNHDVGTYPYLIKAKSGSHFTGQLRIEVSITPRDISDATATVDEAQKYTGSAVTFDESKMTVECLLDKNDTAKTKLVSGTDFAISGWGNNINAASKDNANAPYVTITGKGNYTGTKNVNFSIGDEFKDVAEINSLKSSAATFNQGTNSYTYNGTSQIPTPVVKLTKALTLKDGTTVKAGTVLTEGKDYTVESVVDSDGGNDTTHVGDKTIKVMGMGGYFGELTKTYKITPKDPASAKIRIVPELGYDTTNNYYYKVYDGKAAEPGITVYDDSISTTEPLRQEDWEFYNGKINDDDAESYAGGYINNTDVGKASIGIKLKSDYSTAGNVVSQPFMIIGRDLTTCNLTLKDAKNAALEIGDKNSYLYRYKYQNGDEIKPEVGITDENGNSMILTEGKDYDVSYENDKNAGKATVTVVGKGNYSGTLKVDYAIYASLKTAKVTIADQFYNDGKELNPEIEAVCGGNKLTKYDATTQTGDYIMTETSDDGYTSSGKVTLTSASPFYSDAVTTIYTIKSDASLLKVVDPGNSELKYSYSGSPIKPAFVIEKTNGEALSYDASLVTYESVDSSGNKGADLTNVGTITASIPITIGTKQSVVTVTYKIVPFDISDKAIYSTLVSNYIYDGEKQTISPYIRDTRNGVSRVLQAGADKDYSVVLTSAAGNTISDITDPGTYTATISGNGNYNGTITVTPIAVVPDGMHRLSVESTSTTQIKLKWNRSHDVTGYTVANASSGVVYGETSSNTYTVTGLTAGEMYNLVVKPYVVVSGKRSYGVSDSVTARTTLAAATGTSANSSAGGKVTVNWSTSANVDGYEVYRSATLSGTYKLAAVVPLSYGGFSDTQVAQGSSYYYKLRGYKKEADGSMTYGAYTAAIKTTTN